MHWTSVISLFVFLKNGYIIIVLEKTLFVAHVSCMQQIRNGPKAKKTLYIYSRMSLLQHLQRCVLEIMILNLSLYKWRIKDPKLWF